VEFRLKATLLKIAPAAAVITLALWIVAGSLLRYVSEPNPARAWNEKALLVSDAPRFDLYGEKGPVITLAYNVKNTTNSDYSIETPRLRIVAVLPDGALLDLPVKEFVTVRTPVFIPAYRIGLVVLQLKGLHAPDRNQSESEEAYHERLRQQIMNELLSHVDGFVLLDDLTRYQINLPVGATAKPEKSGESNPDQRNH
jgi:hypothetical protein